MKKYGKILVVLLLLLLTLFSFLLIDNHKNKLKAFDIGKPIYNTDELVVESIGLLTMIDFEVDYEGIVWFLLYDGSNDIYIQITEYDLYDDSGDYLIRLKDDFSKIGKDVYLSVWGDAVEYIYKIEMEYTLNQILEEDMYGEGYNDGYNDGYNTALNKSYNNGYNVGYSNGYYYGYDKGYLDGKSDGLQEQYNYHSIDKVNDNLKDILDLSNKKFYDNVGSYKPTLLDILYIDNILTNVISFYIKLPENSSPNLSINNSVSTLLPNIIDYNLDSPHYYFGNEGILVYVNKSELSTLDVNGFNQWLTNYNFTITYKFTNPQEIILTDEEIAQFPSYKIGFNDGYAEAEGTLDGLSKVVPSVFGSIWLVVSDFLSIEIFGISLWSILLLLSGISLLILLLKMVL